MQVKSCRNSPVKQAEINFKVAAHIHLIKRQTCFFSFVSLFDIWIQTIEMGCGPFGNPEKIGFL